MTQDPNKQNNRSKRNNNRHRSNLWRETADGRSRLTERVENGRKNHDRSRKTMVEKLGFDPDLGWVW